MTKKSLDLYHKFRKIPLKKRVLSKHFSDFLNEIVFRTTKIEHPSLSKKTILSALK